MGVGGGGLLDEGSSVKTGLYLTCGDGGVVAQSNMTPLHIAYNVSRAVYI